MGNALLTELQHQRRYSSINVLVNITLGTALTPGSRT